MTDNEFEEWVKKNIRVIPNQYHSQDDLIRHCEKAFKAGRNKYTEHKKKSTIKDILLILAVTVVWMITLMFGLPVLFNN